MSRATDLARQAIARHQLRGETLEAAIAWAIQRAIDEHGEVATGLSITAAGRYRRMNRVATALTRAPGTAAEIARRSNTDRGNAHRALAELCARGYALRRGRTYMLASSVARSHVPKRGAA